MSRLAAAPASLAPLASAPSLRTLLVFAVVVMLGFGVLLPVAGSGLVALLFPWQASGSLLRDDGRVIGSALVAQAFISDAYFQSRPSAASDDPMAASGSNQARSNPALIRRIADARASVARREGIAPARVPDDLITQSGSGTDPDISFAAAEVQIARVARTRRLAPARVRALVARIAHGPQWGLFGPPRVNVLELNRALDDLVATAPPARPATP